MKYLLALITWFAIIPFLLINKIAPNYGEQLIHSLYKGIRCKKDFILQAVEMETKKGKIKKTILAIETANGKVIYSLTDNKQEPTLETIKPQ